MAKLITLIETHILGGMGTTESPYCLCTQLWLADGSSTLIAEYDPADNWSTYNPRGTVTRPKPMPEKAIS